jgi:hypothetical protein
MSIETKEVRSAEVWHPVEYAGFWLIQDEPYYEGNDVLNAENVGSETAKYNAELAASAPQLKEQNAALQAELNEAKNCPAMNNDLFRLLLDWVDSEDKKNQFIDFFNKQIETEQTVNKLRNLRITQLQAERDALAEKVMVLENERDNIRNHFNY